MIFTGAVAYAAVPDSIFSPAMALPLHLYLLVAQGSTSMDTAYGTALCDDGHDTFEQSAGHSLRKEESEPMEEILMLKNVSVFYGEHPVLKDVNMGIRPGRILAVMGPSGSGKTTLLRALNGLLWEEPEAEMKGEICLLGRDTAPWTGRSCAGGWGWYSRRPSRFRFPFIKI